ncbi:hypothetical protein FOL47_002286, partial [Perkinsus chesapeaki]
IFAAPENVVDEKARICRRNQMLMMITTFMYALIRSVKNSGIFDAYVYILGGQKNTEVGVIASIFGMSSLVLALPAGWLIDHYSRARLLGFGSVVLTAALSLYLVVAMVKLGGLPIVLEFTQSQSSASYSLFADSLPHGHRADAMSTVAILRNVAGGTGPFLGVILVHVLGNEWKLSILHEILLVVALVELPTNWINTLWRDVEHHEHADTNMSVKGGDSGVGETVEVKILTDAEK